YKLSLKEYLNCIGLGERRFFRWNEEKKLFTPSFNLEIEEPIIKGDLRGVAPQVAHPPEPKASELEEIRMKITHLKHKKKRTHGTTALYQQHKGNVSRRQFQYMVKEERKLKNTQFSEKMTRIKWRVTNSCWALDDTFFAKDENGNKVFIHNIKDLATQFILPPLAGKFVCGKEVASNLEKLFIQFGAPMFLKRDNGSNLNHHEVNQLLKDIMLSPLIVLHIIANTMALLSNQMVCSNVKWKILQKKAYL
ncbi:uncharacterized protein METZ01_LOCUS462961, partial [marine metagenome]